MKMKGKRGLCMMIKKQKKGDSHNFILKRITMNAASAVGTWMKHISRSGKTQVCAGVAAVFLMLMSGTVPTYAEVSYMPDVTAEMNAPEFWLGLQPADADTVWADSAKIDMINAAILATPETNTNDLLHYTEVTDGVKFNASVLKSLREDFESYQKKGYYDQYGNEISDALIDYVVNNTQNQMASHNQSPIYAIVTKRTTLNEFPADITITDERGDLNFNYNILSAVRVNDPLIIKSVSADGQWYYALSENCEGWVNASDIALCKNKSEWESAWNIPKDRVLVVADGRIFLAESNTNPATSNLMLTMGTKLEIAPKGSYGTRVTNRSPIGNHVVYVPVRNWDGTYSKELALISAGANVHEGYIPLTKRNVLTVAFRMLGDTYGWGGMLSSNDCSGYIGDVYRCFGLNIPRNTTWQAASPSFGYDVTGFSDEQKLMILNNMPIGSVLFFKGHEMMYLGTYNGKYYVVSSMSSMAYYAGPGIMRTRSVMINTLDMRRANGSTWLSNLYKFQVPYMM